MSDFEGSIIEESLSDKKILDHVEIIAQKVELVTEKHKTPWLHQWTLDTVRISANGASEVAGLLSRSIDMVHAASWYIDYKNDTHHYVIYPNKVFLIERDNSDQYREATDYGVSLGIPDYQVDFSSHVIEWKR